MKILYHPLMLRKYDRTPAGDSGRLESAVEVLGRDPDLEFIEPRPATEEEVLLAHTKSLYEGVKQRSESSPDGLLFEMASLAAGGAIMAGEFAARGEPVFGLIRPPGHHASRDSHWGFCYFNNIAVSLLNLRKKGEISSAFVLDFDLHLGDGNIDILGEDKAWTIYNPDGRGDKEYLADARRVLDGASDVDIIVASAGFDQYENDWGGNLSTDGFRKLGLLMFDFAEERCEGRRYGLLEGGYNFQDLGKNTLAFCEGLRGIE
ncbi:histone deacetylase family protein [Candidatus Thorarchaeota archaeon]|nr:MAG: histone deacetylase family protein [Candidatus Thorarchaeota archaeon]